MISNISNLIISYIGPARHVRNNGFTNGNTVTYFLINNVGKYPHGIDPERKHFMVFVYTNKTGTAYNIL